MTTADAEVTAGTGGEHSEGSAQLEPPAAGKGEQFTMKTRIAAGDERESCMFVRTHDAMIVNRDEIRFTHGSHHVLLYMTSHKDVPTEDLIGTKFGADGIFDCTEGVQPQWGVAGLVGASQNAQGQSAISFPAGVGLRVPANSVLLMNAHYINATDQELEPSIAVNLHSIPESELKHEGGLLFWYNPFLKVPAAGESAMTASCPLPSTIHLTNVQSHMHRRGVGYRATLISPSNERKEVYTSDTWQDVPVKSFSPSLEVGSGSRLEWTCEYRNSESHDIYQGPRSTDEMCMLIGSYYPLDPALNFCARGDQPYFGEQWSIGQGAASCAETLSCISTATAGASAASQQEDGKSPDSMITDCMIASKPSVATSLSAAVGCLGAAGEKGAEACGAEIGACMSAE